MARRLGVTLTIIILSAAALAGMWAVARRWYRPRPVPVSSDSRPAVPATAERKIKATLYFVSEDGLSLVGTEREVPFGEPIAVQARRIVEAQLGEAPAPLATAIPQGTTLRTLFITER